MKLKLACADFAFPLLPHDRVLDLIAMLEFEGVDIGLFEGRSHLWPSNVLASPVRSGKQLGRKLAARGLRCAADDVQCAGRAIVAAFARERPSVLLGALGTLELKTKTPSLARLGPPRDIILFKGSDALNARLSIAEGRFG